MHYLSRFTIYNSSQTKRKCRDHNKSIEKQIKDTDNIKTTTNKARNKPSENEETTTNQMRTQLKMPTV